MTWTLEFAPPAELMNVNRTQRMHWAAYAKLRKQWREAAKVAAVNARNRGEIPRKLPPCFVTFVLPVKGKRVRDPLNWAPTAKHGTDGLTDAGLWPDDNELWVKAMEPIMDTAATNVVIVLVPMARVIPSDTECEWCDGVGVASIPGGESGACGMCDGTVTA